MSFCRSGREKKKKKGAVQTPASSEFGVAVCVALYRDELFHAGGATLVYGAVPRVGRRSHLVALAEDVRHGVGAALDVRAVEKRATVVADLLHPMKYQVGFPRKGEDETL